MATDSDAAEVGRHRYRGIVAGAVARWVASRPGAVDQPSTEVWRSAAPAGSEPWWPGSPSALTAALLARPDVLEASGYVLFRRRTSAGMRLMFLPNTTAEEATR